MYIITVSYTHLDVYKRQTKYLQETSKEVGSPITVTRYARFERGEGIEKVEEDFAAEVAKTMGLQ